MRNLGKNVWRWKRVWKGGMMKSFFDPFFSLRCPRVAIGQCFVELSFQFFSLFNEKLISNFYRSHFKTNENNF